MMIGPEHSGSSGSRVDILSLSPNNPHSPGFDSSVGQTHVFSLSSMSHSERRCLAKKLKTELEQVTMLLKKIDSLSSNAITNMQSHGEEETRVIPVNKVTAVRSKKKGRAKAMKKNRLPQKTNHVALMKQCETLLNQLMMQNNAVLFNSPVDIVAYNIPDYFDVIKRPMDLGTIKTKLLSGKYSSPQGFAADVRLTFKNAMTYNPPGNDVHLIAVLMKKFFETRWTHIEKKIPVTMVEANIPSLPPAKKQKITSTFEPFMRSFDKRKLEEELEALQEELPEDIINFLKESTSNGIEMDEDEIAVDIYALSDHTLFKLRKLLDDYKAKKQKNQAKIWPCNLEQMQNNSGCSNSHVEPQKDKPCTELAEKDVDMAKNDLPVSNSPRVEIDEDAARRDSQSSSSSSSDSDSSSSSTSSFST